MPDRTMTINIDKTVSLDESFLAIQGEQITVDAVIPAGLASLGYDAYIDFLLPDGSAYFKGGYDCSSGTVSFDLGASDSILDKDGDVIWQFVLATTVGSVRTAQWKSMQMKTVVLPSINATSSAVLPYVPQMVFPNMYPAANVSIDDVGGWLGDGNVEDALQNVGHAVDNLNWEVGSLNYNEENYIVSDESLTDSVDKLDIALSKIIESGSNANGTYIKYADGTMICTKSVSLGSLAMTTALGGLFHDATPWAIGDWAVEFHAIPVCSITIYVASGVAMYAVYTKQTITAAPVIKAIYPVSATETVTVDVTAIGRWKA